MALIPRVAINHPSEERSLSPLVRAFGGFLALLFERRMAIINWTIRLLPVSDMGLATYTRISVS
jgi:hypothetical protein